MIFPFRAQRDVSKRVRLALAFGVALLVFLALFDWTWCRPLVQHFLQQKSGRRVDFDELRIGLDAALQPTVRLRNLRVQNAPWASPQPLVQAGELAVTLSWRHLFSDPMVVTRLVLVDAELDLERQADGLRNWRLTRPDDRGPGRVRVLSVDAQRTRLRFVHRGAQLELRLKSTPLASPAQLAGRSSLPLTRGLQFSGVHQGVAFDGQAQVSETLTLFDTAQPFALRGQIRAARASLDIEGVGQDLFGTSAFEAALRYRADGSDELARLLGVPARTAVLPAEASAQLRKDGGRWTLAGLQARAGSSDLSGSLVFDQGHRGDAVGERRHLQATLHSTRLDWRELQSGRDARASLPQAAGEEAATGRRGDLDAEIDWHVEQLTGVPLGPLGALQTHLSLRGQRLTAEPLSFTLAGGQATGGLVLDGSRSPREASARLQLRGLELARLSPRLAGQQVVGRLAAELRLQSRGDSVATLTAAATGSVRAGLAGARIPAALDAKLGLDAGRWLRAKLGRDERTAIDCSVLELDFERGRGKVRRLALETAQVELTGSGSIDLPQRTVDLTLLPRRKQAALLALDRAARVRGPFDNLAVTLVDVSNTTRGPPCAPALPP